jgi:predicted XRE-type DNA-binding protein
MRLQRSVVRTDPVPAIKRQLVDEILAAVAHLTATIAASLLEIDASRMSDLRHGRFARFSVERLIRMLSLVERRVDVVVTPTGPVPPRWFTIMRERRQVDAR